MSVKIRLSRGGTKKRPFYRIVVADARMPRDGRFVEKIGTFYPLKAQDDATRAAPPARAACPPTWTAPSANATTTHRGRCRRRRRKSAPPLRRPQPKRPQR